MLDQTMRLGADQNGSTSLLVCKNVRVSTRILPARRAAFGGDWCEAFNLSEGLIALSIGDVSGHGANTFGPMTMIRRVVRDAALAGLQPDAVLTLANTFVCTFGAEFLATALFAVLDTTLGKLTFANAGHPPPLIIDDGQPRFLSFGDSDLALGVESVLSPMVRIQTLRPNALLVLYTDGVTERDRDLLRGEEELRAAAYLAHQGNAASAAANIEELLGLSGSNADDAAILTVSIDRSGWGGWKPQLPDAAVVGCGDVAC